MIFRTKFLNKVFLNQFNRNLLQIYCRKINSATSDQDNTFEPIYKLESIKYISLFNRFKIYQLVGSGIAIPISAALEVFDILPSNSFFSAAYLGVTGFALLSLGSLITRNVVGFLYITEDNKFMKISIVDYWGRRRDHVMPLDDWVPLEELPDMKIKLPYFSPRLQDGTNLKLFFSQGKILKKEKIHLL